MGQAWEEELVCRQPRTFSAPILLFLLSCPGRTGSPDPTGLAFLWDSSIDLLGCFEEKVQFWRAAVAHPGRAFLFCLERRCFLWAAPTMCLWTLVSPSARASTLDVGLAGTSWEWREAGLPVAWLGSGTQCA